MFKNREFISDIDFFINKHSNILKPKQKNLIKEGKPADVTNILQKMINYLPTKNEIYRIALDKTIYEIQQKFDMATDAKFIYKKYITREI